MSATITLLKTWRYQQSIMPSSFVYDSNKKILKMDLAACWPIHPRHLYRSIAVIALLAKNEVSGGVKNEEAGVGEKLVVFWVVFWGVWRAKKWQKTAPARTPRSSIWEGSEASFQPAKKGVFGGSILGPESTPRKHRFSLLIKGWLTVRRQKSRFFCKILA